MDSKSIDDYAIIGDCRSAALVSRDGSIDWLCWPRFDSPPIFAAILDERAGRWSLRPKGAFRSRREYAPDTNILRTRFETDDGILVVTDFMPVGTPAQKRGLLGCAHEIVRKVECERGQVRYETEYAPAPDFGRGKTEHRRADGLGLRLEIAAGLLTLRCAMPLEWDGRRARGEETLRAGERREFGLSLAVHWPEAYAPLEAWARESLEQTAAWWRSWAARLTYEGPARGPVVRSALFLRLMFYAPSGAVIAAPTTSLPEKIGGGYNWDYRYCWLRDASLTVRALLGLGCDEEAEAFVRWLLDSTSLTRPEFQVLYDVHGNPPEREHAVAGLRGYRSSLPVRVGNAADRQLQLDIYGEVVGATALVVARRAAADMDTRRLLLGLGDSVCRLWREPDEGIWEPRSGRAHRTHSKVLCWSAVDRLLDLHAKGRMPDAPVERYESARRAMRAEIDEKAWNPALNSYVPVYGGTGTDASLLLMSWHGFLPADSPRMRGTYARIRKNLDAGDGLLYRNDDEETAGEAAFGICGFWAAEFLAAGGGTLAEARDLFERLCAHGNDAGLFAEETDPATKAALGNFPQAFTHVGLINAALTIERAAKGRGAMPGESVNWGGAALWGFCATIILTTVLSLCQGLGITRVSIAYILGTMVTDDRDRAKAVGFAMHLAIGWLIAFLYAAVFESLGAAGWERGAVIGLAHGAFVLSAGMRLLPGIHPRMASEQQGPTLLRGLEPPGFLGRNYGNWTPLSVIVAHVAYGTILGAFYVLPSGAGR